jgi:RHS repeat-associated protein
MSRTWSGIVSGSVAATHDDFFRVASRAVDGQGALSMLYDADGLYAGTSGLASYSVTRDFNGKNGLLAGSTLGGVSDAYTYNGFGELKTYATTVSGSPLYASSVTARDANGRIQAMTDALAGTMHTWSFTYDPRGELATAVEDGVSTAYTYDPNGNRLTSGGQSSTYDAQDRILTSPGATYTYTSNGDLLTKVTSVGTTAYAYDLQRSLRSVALPGSDTVAYVIDGEGHRVGRTWTHGGQSVTQGFLYDDALRVSAELDGEGNVVSTFVYGTKANVPDAMVRGGNTYRLLTDWRGSVRAVVDVSAGTIVETIDYDAWGNATVSDTTCASGTVCALFQPFGFAGGVYDRETGLVRFGARDYDASVGRWGQKDPIRFGGRQPNLYVYAGDEPIDVGDPRGLVVYDCFRLVEGSGPQSAALHEFQCVISGVGGIGPPVCFGLGSDAPDILNGPGTYCYEKNNQSDCLDSCYESNFGDSIDKPGWDLFTNNCMQNASNNDDTCSQQCGVPSPHLDGTSPPVIEL